VSIGSLKQTFSFEAWEPIHVEISRKYEIATIRKYAAKAGFFIKELFYDAKQFYVNALWEKE
jgi:L-histidine N-alpha-methyltransferase